MDTTERRNQNQQTKQARVKRSERRQMEWQAVSLDQLLAADHRAREGIGRGWCGGMSIRSI